jgi:hypothetical protein
VRRLAILLVSLALPALLSASPAAAANADPFAQSCPAKALEEGAAGKLNHNPAAKRAIVPAGAIALRLCRYYGFGAVRQTPKTQARVGDLRDQTVVHSRAVLEGLTLEFKELAAAPKGPVNCPEDEGAELYAVFFYRAAEPVVLHVSLSGCRFVSGGAPRARDLSTSLEHKLLRLVEGRRVKAPKHPKVTEKSVAQHHPPHLKLAKARHMVEEELVEDCADLCSSSKVTGCDRRTDAIVACHVEATLPSGRVCRSHYTLREFEEGSIAIEGAVGNVKSKCDRVFLPPEIREHLEEEESGEKHERGEAKGTKRSYDRTAGG